MIGTYVEHYFNFGYNSSWLDRNNHELGITDLIVTSTIPNTMTFSFSRDNWNPNPNYFDIEMSDPYVLIAYGAVNEYGKF